MGSDPMVKKFFSHYAPRPWGMQPNASLLLRMWELLWGQTHSKDMPTYSSNVHGFMVLPRAARIGAILTCISMTCLTFSGYDNALCAARKTGFPYRRRSKAFMRTMRSIARTFHLN